MEIKLKNQLFEQKIIKPNSITLFFDKSELTLKSGYDDGEYI